MAEEKKKLKVYCETSFWSFLNGRPTPLAHIALKQAATLRWWQEIAPKCEIYISQHVKNEVGDGCETDAVRRADSIRGCLQLDGLVPEVTALARRLIEGHALPSREITDAAHIAAAAVYGMDVLLTWNCRHMANPVTLPKTAMLVGVEGFRCPVIITPAEFLERKEDFHDDIQA